MRLRAHDLRGTFITLALGAGRSESWVAARTGHGSTIMISRYRSEAMAAAELRLGWFLPLHEAIPELAAVTSDVDVPTPAPTLPIPASQVDGDDGLAVGHTVH